MPEASVHDLSPAALTSPSDHVERLIGAVNDAIRELELPAEPAELYAPVRYVMEGGGKRIRPVLVLLAAEACGGPVQQAMPAALAAEVFHNFTLVHDDIMDHAAERRGRPTVHVVWNESTAILTGDLLMGLAFDLLAQTETEALAPMLRTFYQMVARVCEGQALDEAFEERDDVTVDDYLDMISRKTGALLECVLELGARVAGADERTRERLTTAGRELGRAFQIQDDLLDLTAEHAGWGKTIGGDLIEGKKTFLLLRALERAEGDEAEWFRRIVTHGGLPAEEVPEARARMDALGVLSEARQSVQRHSERATVALAQLPPSAARESLLWLADRLSGRSR